VPYLHAPEDLAEILPGEPSYRVDQLRGWLYRHPVLDPGDMTNLPAAIRENLGGLWPFDLEIEQSADAGTTRKWLFRAPDGAAIETVLMGYRRRATVCISSQAGCALGCTFCATGQFGFERNLQAGEIVAQVAYAQAFLRQIGMPSVPDHVTNVVFMGMGEPLANYDRVRESIRRMVETMGLSARAITVSTVGMVPGMNRLADEPWPVYLAVSLHAADDELRDRLVPINRRYPLEAVEEAAAGYLEKKRRRLSIEWTMINGVNDTEQQARKLADIAKRLRAHVNLIALNPTPMTEATASDRSTIGRFARTLEGLRVNVTIRDTRGRDIDAACGQLRVLAGRPGLKPRLLDISDRPPESETPDEAGDR
jgi:23S rRNA (adenine2503-C2)-methyltransferase